jgi:hypothetical protein
MSTPHIEEDLLDEYAVGTLTGEAIAEIEEHLLMCSFCQKRLVETDEFVIVFRSAATQLNARPASAWKRLSRFRIVSWAGATAAAAALLAFLISQERYNTHLPPATVLMQSPRGAEAAAHTASGRPCLLVFDLAISATPADYEITIVDAAGNEILKTAAAVLNGRLGRLNLLVQKLARGSYWVRVYRKQADREQLVAEYGLRAE